MIENVVSNQINGLMPFIESTNARISNINVELTNPMNTPILRQSTVSPTLPPPPPTLSEDSQNNETQESINNEDIDVSKSQEDTISEANSQTDTVIHDDYYEPYQDEDEMEISSDNGSVND